MARRHGHASASPVRIRTMGLSDFLARLPRGDLWIFGYGSLMWAPGFRASERAVALLHGYHRALCILSHRHRGTPEIPGLVMGLCRGGSCWGMAFRVPQARRRGVLVGLWHREMRNRVYAPRLLIVRAGARQLRALAFVANPGHPQFAGELDLHSRARLVAQGIGERGRCLDYIRNTVAHMSALGVRDPHLEGVLRAALELHSRRARQDLAKLTVGARPTGRAAPRARSASARALRRGVRAACRN
jgi:glutathione-specific gamma-glutamylcyclotransferase